MTIRLLLFLSRVLTSVFFYLQTIGLFGLLRAVKGKLTGSPAIHSVKIKNSQTRIYLRVPSSDVMTYKKVFIHQELVFFHPGKPAVIIDAGANTGLTALFFAHTYPGATIIAIEPEESNFKLLIKNTEGFPDIIPIRAALWNKNEEILLLDPGRGKWGFVTEKKDSRQNREKDTGQTVPTVTVSQLINDYKLKAVDILKIDIEGSEKELFEEAAPWIDKVETIIIELHDRIKDGASRSFYNSTQDFTSKWEKGENIFISKCGARK